MKRLAVVAKNGVAIIVNESNEIVAQNISADSTTALLNAMKEVIASYPVNSAEDLGEAVTLYLPQTIRGIASGAVRNYIREGKTSRDKEMQPETIALYKEVMILLGERNLTVDVKDAQYASKNSPEVIKLVNNAWNKVKTMSNVSANTATQQAPQEQANPKVLAKIKEIEDQIVDAILEDDEELEASLNAKLAKLKAMLPKRDSKALAEKVAEEVKQEIEKEEFKEEQEVSYEDVSAQFDAMMNA